MIHANYIPPHFDWFDAALMLSVVTIFFYLRH